MKSKLKLYSSYRGYDNCAIMDFNKRHLTGHSWTYLRNFWSCRIFFRAKLPPGTAKTFGCWKTKFFKSRFYQSHVMAFGLTIPKWYNTWVLQIFFVNIFFKNWKKIFWKIFLTKYLQKIFAIPKCYTILESWEQMPQHGFDKNLIWRNFFFNIQRGDPLDFQKRFLQCGGGNYARKKILQY